MPEQQPDMPHFQDLMRANHKAHLDMSSGICTI